MSGLVKYFCSKYGCEMGDTKDLRRELFWSCIRSSLYKKVCKEKNSRYQWAYITGKKSRNSKGSPIMLSLENLKHFWNVIDYLHTEEGVYQMHEHGIFEEPPEHPDDLISIIRNAMTDREIKREIFRLFMKNKHKILDFLADS